MVRVARLILTLICAAHSATALACSPPPVDVPRDLASVASDRPAMNVPEGAIQLLIAGAEEEEFESFNLVGKINLRVKDVLNGNFSQQTVLLNAGNVDNCNSHFYPPRRDFYITVLPLHYQDGEPILDREGRQEFGPLFYNDPDEFYPGTRPSREQVEYSSFRSFHFEDYENFSCIFRFSDGSWDFNAEAWRRCVAPGEYLGLDCDDTQVGKLVCQQDDYGSVRPPELRRGYTFWSFYGRLIAAFVLPLAIALGLGLFLLRKKFRAARGNASA